jgi:hypothetical protein
VVGAALKHLKDRTHYEDTYDRHTVELAREKKAQRVSKESQKSLASVEPKLSGDRAIKWLEAMWGIEAYLFAGERWENRSDTVQKWINRDSAMDDRLESARLTIEPTCSHCGRHGLRIISKDLLNSDLPNSQVEQVVFMLKCPHCQRNSAYWEDGTEWKLSPTTCPKCNSEMRRNTSRRGKVHTTTYFCPDCAYTYKEKLELATPQDPAADPEFLKDKEEYCLDDKRGQEFVEDMGRWERLRELFSEQDERDANKELYEAVAKIQKLKITQLHELLKPAIERVGFTEVRFAEPEIGREVVVGISCLDGNNKREDYDSRKALKKTILQTLDHTNWRLVNNDIEYRLGYLSGRVRAYEKEPDLIKLAQKRSESQNNP